MTFDEKINLVLPHLPGHIATICANCTEMGNGTIKDVLRRMELMGLVHSKIDPPPGDQHRGKRKLWMLTPAGQERRAQL